MKRQLPTVKQHIEIARNINAAEFSLLLALAQIQDHYPKNHPAVRGLARVISIDGPLARARSRLDTDWHRAIDERQFKEHGHVYFGGRR